MLSQVLFHVSESFTDVSSAVKLTINCMIGTHTFFPHLCYLLDAFLSPHISDLYSNPIHAVCLASTSLASLHFVLQLFLFALFILLF